jgi:hypothetical protein
MSKSLFYFLMLNAQVAICQKFISGSVVDQSSQKPIAYVNITLSDGTGTATDEAGYFLMPVDPDKHGQKAYFSCIGFYSRVLEVDSLIKSGQHQHTFDLRPFITQLEEVRVEGKRLTAEEIVLEAIRAIPVNYIQQPFNLEYYSKISTLDSTNVINLIETVSRCYRTGYKNGAQNFAEVLEKRISGDSVLRKLDKKRQMTYFIYELLPQFDIFLVDMIGVGNKFNYTVFNPEYLNKLEFRLTNTTQVDSDTVMVIEYDEKNFKKEPHRTKLYGALYISISDLAIVKHVRRIGRNNLEILYKKQNGQYFPYFFKTDYQWTGEKGNEPLLRVTHEGYVKKIVTQQVQVVDRPQANWHLEDVPYRKEFWEKYFPKRKEKLKVW